MINFFELSSLNQFILQTLPLPQSLSESIQFLTHPYSQLLPQQTNHSFSILVQNIENLSLDDLDSLTNSQLFQLFTSPKLKIENEDFLFQMTTKLIERNSSRKFLLNSIQFEFVSANLLKQYFENIYLDDIDFDLFESLKKRLFCEIIVSHSDPILDRYKSKPKIVSSGELQELYQIFNSFFEEEGNPVHQAKLLIQQIQMLKEENLNFKNPFRKEIQIDLVDNKGIISYLRHQNSNSIITKCSGMISQIFA